MILRNLRKRVNDINQITEIITYSAIGTVLGCGIAILIDKIKGGWI